MLSMFAAAAAALGSPSAAVAPTSLADEAAIGAWLQGNHKSAISHWVALAKRDDPDGLYNIGQAFHLGRGVPQNDKAALGFFRKARDAGHPKAAEQLGLFLYGDPARQSEAIPFLQEAAARGSGAADYILGVARVRGGLMPRDLALAFLYLSRAAERGIDQARRPLAVVRLEMSPADRSRAMSLGLGMNGE